MLEKIQLEIVNVLRAKGTIVWQMDFTIKHRANCSVDNE